MIKHDELGFINQQLAGMLKAGIPLEKALQQLCATMQAGKLREEFTSLEADLREGLPLSQALDRRQLPELYVAMIKVGAKSNALPLVLTLLADHYHRTNLLWTKLKGVMLYPLIVLVAALGLSLLFIKAYRDFGQLIFVPVPSFWDNPHVLGETIRLAGVFLPAIVLGLGAIFAGMILFFPALRRRVLWRVGVFRDAHISNFASSLAILLRSGCNLTDAIALLQRLETNTPLGQTLAQWQTRLAEGKSAFAEFAIGNGNVIPPLFYWLVSNEGEEMEKGLTRAAEIYHARALSRTDLLLHAALPVSFLLLGVIVAVQLFCVLQPGLSVFEALNATGEM